MEQTNNQGNRAGDDVPWAAVLTMILGPLLGVADTAATLTSGWLRVPALIAALVLTAQGVLDYKAATKKVVAQPVYEITEAPVGVVATRGKPMIVGAPGAAVHREAPSGDKLTLVSNVRESHNVLIIALMLAIWLGLAVLAFPAAPWPLTALSLIASFALFAEAWGALRGGGDRS